MSPPPDRAPVGDALEDTLPSPAGAVPLPGLPMLRRGDHLGRFTVLDVVGAGRMGVVLSAYDPQLDRKVAIKVLKAAAADLLDADARSRLLREAQALARVAHPNVVSVFEVGTVNDQVFMAMEYVPGRTLSVWMKERPRRWQEVVSLICAAGRGLSAAHREHLIHRDFKPDNVQVGHDERPRVTDFGLVGLEEPSEPVTDPSAGAGPGASVLSSLELPLTRSGSVVGTPAYMSPEQFRGGVVDARADQFAFAVVLWEALYGQRPFAGDDFPTLQGNVLSGKLLTPQPETRVPERLHAILSRALSVEPDQRYAELDELLLVLTTLVSRSELGRRRAFAWAGAALVALTTAGTAWMALTQSGRQCSGSEKNLAGVWDDSQRAAIQLAFAATEKPFAADAARTAGHQLDSYAIAWAHMREQVCEATRRGEVSESVLALQLACLGRRLEALGALVTVLRAADGTTVQSAVEATAGLPPLETCADPGALASLVPLPEDPGVRTKVDELKKSLGEPKALLLAGQYQKGLGPAQAVVAQATAVGYRPILAESEYVLARLQDGVGDFKAAERTVTAAVQAAQEGRDDELEVRALTELAMIAGTRQARWEAAHDALAMGKATMARLGRHETLQAELRLMEGRLLLVEGKFQDALAVTQEVLDFDRRVLGDERVETANAEYYVSQCLFRLGRVDEAIEASQKALTIRQKALGPVHPQTADAIHLIATLYQISGRLDEALPLYLQALSIRERALGPNHPDLAFSLNNLTALFAAQQKLKEALPYAERTLQVQTAAYGEENPYTATALHNLGALRADMKEYAQALEWLEKALRVREKALGPDHPDVAASLTTMSTTLVHLGRAKEGLAAARRALAIREKALPAGHREIANALLSVAFANMKLGRAADALPDAERALQIREATKGLLPSDLADARFAVASALWEVGKDRARARELAKAAKNAYTTLKNEDKLNEVDKWLAKSDAGMHSERR